MYINYSFGNSEKGTLLMQNEIRTMDSLAIVKHEKLWITKVSNLLNEIYESLMEKQIDNQKITKETIAEYFFQEVDLKYRISQEMKIALKRPLSKIEEQLVDKIIQAMELNLISLWMDE